MFGCLFHLPLHQNVINFATSICKIILVTKNSCRTYRGYIYFRLNQSHYPIMLLLCSASSGLARIHFFIPSIPSYWATILVTNEQPQTSVCCSSLWGRHITQLRSEGGTAAGRTLIKTTSVAMRRKVEKKRWSEKDGQEQRKGMKRVCMKKQERVIGSKTLMTLLCSGKAASCAIHHQNLYISFS